MKREFPLNWGILGCARIAKKNIRAIKLSNDNELIAIASRSIEKVKQFAFECDLPNSVTLYSNYDDLLLDNRINAVYIPLPSIEHLEWVSKAAKQKKHILLEKPTAINDEILNSIIAVCNENEVFFMDGVMFMHHERMHKLRIFLSDSFVGKINRINSSFSFNGSKSFLMNDIRANSNGDPLGALGDLGWYCIRLGLIAFSHGDDINYFGNLNVNSNKVYLPTKCSVRCNKWTDDKVPLDCEGIIWFQKNGLDNSSSDKYLRFDCSFLIPFRQSFEISISCDEPKKEISDKVVRCNDFVIPKSDCHDAKFQVEIHPSNGTVLPYILSDHATRIVTCLDEYSGYGCQEANMFSTFSTYILSNNEMSKDIPYHGIPAVYWTNISLWNQIVIDACLKSMLLEAQIVDILPPY